jgi:hypothetical protein
MWAGFVWAHGNNPIEHENGPFAYRKFSKFIDYLSDS